MTALLRSRLPVRALLAALLLAPTLLPALAPELEPFFQAIRQRESAGHPWSIFDNTTHRSYRLSSRAEAERLAGELVALGHNLDLGLYQLNWHWQGRRANLTLANVFDPAVNESVARTILAEFHAAARALYASTDEAVRMAVGAYNNGRVRVHNPGYVNGVFRLAGLAPPYATTGDRAPRGAAMVRAPAAGDKVGGITLMERDDLPAFGLPSSIDALLAEDDATAVLMETGDWMLMVVAPILLVLAALVVLGACTLLGAKLVPWLTTGLAGVARRAALAAALRVRQRLTAETARLAQEP